MMQGIIVGFAQNIDIRGLQIIQIGHGYFSGLRHAERCQCKNSGKDNVFHAPNLPEDTLNANSTD